MRVRVRGQVYETVRETAEALDVSVSTVKWAVQRGTTDWIGVGSGRSPRRRDMACRVGMPQPVEVEILGRRWESLGALSRWMGRHSGWASQVIRKRGRGALYEEVVARLMRD